MEAIIFDTETTGFHEPRIIEAAWLECSILPGGLIKLGDDFCQRYNPGKPIACGAMAVHHIMDEDLVNEPSASLFRLPEVTYLIGHSVDYDWEVAGKPEVRRICTLALARRVWPDAEHSQSALMYLLERARAREMVRNAHSALADVRMCSIILGHLVAALQVQSLEDLWIKSEEARIPTHMPFGKHKGWAIKDLPSDYVRWLLRQPDVDPYVRAALTGRHSSIPVSN